MIHAGDKYLSSSNEKFDEEKFVKTLKFDHLFVPSTLPEWDAECEKMAKGESYESFFRKRALVIYQSQSEVDQGDALLKLSLIHI